MKKRLFFGFILVSLLSACATSAISATADFQRTPEVTRENPVMQTIIAREQITITPTPGGPVNLPDPWTEITTTTATPAAISSSAIATALRPLTSILVGAGYSSYLMACYVDEGTQLKITGRTVDSRWLRVVFDLGQTCFIMDEGANRRIIIPEPTLQLWVFYTTVSISGDLSTVDILLEGTPTPLPSR